MNLFRKKAADVSNTIDLRKEAKKWLSRGIENVFPTKESLESVLSSGKKIKIYLGIDPTGPSLHMGHAIPLMKLGELQKLGHKVILLMGDFTAMIGDPSDKMAARKQLSRKEVLSNLRSYKDQASVFLSFKGENAAEIRYNSEWLSKMSFEDVLGLASKMTVDQMLKRDMFRKRAEEGKPTYIHEFLYPLMQGFDSIALDVDAEIGGNDQTFNMLAGRDLMKSMKDKEKFVIATKLLVDPSGKKMGKTEGNMISLSDSPEEMFGKVMSWPDDMIIPGFELCTRKSDEEIEEERAYLSKGGNPKESKMRLGESIVAIYHGDQKAGRAKASFQAAFSEGVMPAETPRAEAAAGTPVVDVLLANKVVSSKTDWRRLVSEGAVKNLTSGKNIEDPSEKIATDTDLKVGKHRFIKIIAK